MQLHAGTQILPAEQTPILGIAVMPPERGRAGESSSQKRSFTFPLFDEYMRNPIAIFAVPSAHHRCSHSP
ncbi:hypothetical protein HBI24_220260 [Parastagonospora nodorum]|nr:hypothetical protein HBH52_163010 [Parastagonospora nodorum]KAH4193480.1 hypothetical protein HBH42_101210 [Parastagonospora nodorum]KAH4933486.1 hypothetical protein HBI79_089900 [Parastagonospora nodorum]KAH5409783.1 hypothetical protein HBI32_139380 [Parastagonospora nodorum]KAH5570119.1 hypothetical protein HBI24_220260 [Parastagonospora nodorum]